MKHGQESKSLLLEALRSNDWDTRRYSAFCLGLIGDPSIIPDLRAAILREPEKVSTAKIRVGEGTARLPLFVLRAMVQAYARIDSREAFMWLLGTFRPGINHIKNYAANYSLSIMVNAGYPDFALDEKSMWQDMGPKWKNWWSNYQKRPDSDLFRNSSSSQKKLAYKDAPKHASGYSDLDILFQPYSSKLLCTKKACELTIEDLFAMISRETGIPIHYDHTAKSLNLKIQQLSLKDSFIFAVQSANLQYRVYGNSIEIISH